MRFLSQSFLCALVFGAVAGRAAEPYEEFLHKSYAETIDSLSALLYRMEDRSYSRETEMAEWNKVRNVARRHGNTRLELGVDIELANIYRYKYPIAYNELIGRYNEAIDKARRAGEEEMRLFCLDRLADFYFTCEDYDNCFAVCLELEKSLDYMPDERFRDKNSVYLHLSLLYYAFREYAPAIRYLRKAVAIAPTGWNFNSYYSALNTLGLCYDNINEPDSAAACYRMIIDDRRFAHEPDRRTHAVIAGKNLADGYAAAGAYEQAIPLYTAAMEYMPAVNDSAFATGAALALAEVYVAQGKASQARRLFDALPRAAVKPPRLAAWYAARSRYAALTGSYRQALAYRDSVMQAEKETAERLNAMRLLRVQQRITAEEKHTEQLAASAFRRSMGYLLAGLTLFFTGVAAALYLYGKRREAKRALIRFNKRWAGIEMSYEPDGGNGNNHAVALPKVAPPETGDIALMAKIDRLMTEQEAYKDPELALDEAAAALGAKAYAVSQAINRCRQMNVKTYLNEYRVKEAMRMLAGSNNDYLTVEGIAFEAGFADRRSFYRVFKKYTGLSPSDFSHQHKK